MARYHFTRLPNGVTVASAEMPHMASVSLGLWVGVGGRFEPESVTGVCHFIEHMLFKGTKKRSALQISQAVEGVGGYLNAFTSEEHTCFYARSLHDHLGDLVDVLADMFLHSLFASAELNREREVIKEEVAMYNDQPSQFVHELLNATLWPDHPLGRPLTGTTKDLDRLNRAAMLDFMHRFYVAPCSLWVAAGNLHHEQLVKLVSRYAKYFRAGKAQSFIPATHRQTAPQVKLHTRKTEQTQVALGIRTCSRHDERRFALRLLNAVLGENMSSRLFQEIRESRGLAYNIYSSPSFFDDAGDLVIAAGVDMEKLPVTLRLVMRELKRLCTKPLSAPELRRARDYVIGQFEQNLEMTENHMTWLGEQLLGHGRIQPPSQVQDRLSRVRAADIRRAAQDFFKPERMNLALVSPLKSDRGLASLLAI